MLDLDKDLFDRDWLKPMTQNKRKAMASLRLNLKKNINEDEVQIKRAKNKKAL